MTLEPRDAVVIGSGVGGLVAAAQLVLRGRRPLVLEAADRLGGRFSTVERDGFKLPTGAVAIETVGPFWDTFAELGFDAGLRIPDPAVRVRVRGHDLQPGAAVWEHLVKRVTKAAGGVAEHVSRARSEDVDSGVMLDAWVRRYTRSRTVASLFQSLSAAIFTVNADELPAGVFFRNLRETGGYKRYGFAPNGNVVLARALAAAITARGGEVKTGWRVTAIEADDRTATAVRAIGPSGTEDRITCAAIVSNAGPRVTARLVEGPAAPEFAARVRDVRTTSLITLAFSTHEPVVPYPGIWAFTDTQRLCNLANLGATCPELAPAGRTLYEAYSAPRPSVGGVFDVELERRLLEEDLRAVIPGFARAEVVRFKAMHGDEAPAQQCRPGFDPPVRTPLANVADVGDGVKPYGWIGTTACAQTAREAVAALESVPYQSVG